MKQAGGPPVPGGAVAVLGERRLDLDVAVSAAAIAAARHAVVDHLARRGVPSTVVDDMELVTSELVTNAIVHARPTSGRPVVQLSLELSDTIELVVVNNGSVDAIPPVDDWGPAPPHSPSRRGLGIVRRLCDAVVVEQAGERAVIRCRRRLPDRGANP
jgi:anti-sigma regulatory factor (Ser/Thr protein kinase)